MYYVCTGRWNSGILRHCQMFGFQDCLGKGGGEAELEPRRKEPSLSPPPPFKSHFIDVAWKEEEVEALSTVDLRYSKLCQCN